MERKRKAIPNRTIGLQTKVIQDCFKDETCKTCNGSGKYKIFIESKTIRNMKNQLGHICLENDCTCNNGVVRTKMRVIRKNGISAIV
jgi:hypothetical protein